MVVVANNPKTSEAIRKTLLKSIAKAESQVKELEKAENLEKKEELTPKQEQKVEAVKEESKELVQSLKSKIKTAKSSGAKTKKSTPPSSKLMQKARELARKYRTAQKGVPTGDFDIERDAGRPALPKGRRIAKKSGKVYYENRENRIDRKQPPKNYPKLREGGEIDSLYTKLVEEHSKGGYEKMGVGFDRFLKMKMESALEKGDNKMHSKLIDVEKLYESSFYDDGGLMKDFEKNFTTAYILQQQLDKKNAQSTPKSDEGFSEYNYNTIYYEGKHHPIRYFDSKGFASDELYKAMRDESGNLKGSNEREIEEEKIYAYFPELVVTKNSPQTLYDKWKSGEGITVVRTKKKGWFFKDGGELSNFEKKIKDAMKEENKWHFINEEVGGKNVQLKMFVGKKEVDVQIFRIDGYAARMPRNYVGKRDTLKMIMDNLNPPMEYGGILEPMTGGVNADPRFDIYNTGAFMEKGGEFPVANSKMVGKTITVQLPNSVKPFKDKVITEYSDHVWGKKGVWDKKYIVSNKSMRFEDGGMNEGGDNEFLIMYRSDNPAYQGEDGFEGNPPDSMYADSAFDVLDYLRENMPDDVEVISIEEASDVYKKGGYMAKGGKVDKFNVSFNYNPSNLSNKDAEKIVSRYTKNWKHDNDFDEVSFFVMGLSKADADSLAKELKMENTYNLEIEKSRYEYGGILQPMTGGVNADPRFDIYNTGAFMKKGGYMAKGGKLKVGGDDFSFLLELSDKELTKRLDLVRKQQIVNAKQYFEAKEKGNNTQNIEESGERLQNQETAIIQARIRKNKMADGGLVKVKWSDAEYGDSARVIAENKMGLILKPYGQKFHLKFPDGTEKTYTAKELEFYKEQEYKHGGDVKEHSQNLEMLENQAKEFKHHAEELQNVLKSNPEVDAWVVAKAERATTDLSDITHYLDGLKKKMADGGSLPEGYHMMPDGTIMPDSAHMKKGGETEGVDLFEDYEKIPSKVQKILDKYADAFEDGDYKELEKATKELSKIGYTFEYGLDGQAYDLRKIGQKGKSEEYSYGGKMAMGGVTEHGLKEGDEILVAVENVIAVYNHKTGESAFINIETGKREDAPNLKEKMQYLSKMADGGEVKNLPAELNKLLTEKTDIKGSVNVSKEGFIVISAPDKDIDKLKRAVPLLKVGIKFTPYKKFVKKMYLGTDGDVKDSLVVELNDEYKKMAEGGKVKFADKVASVKKSLLKRKKVPKAVQKDYGKTFSPAEAEDSAKRIVGAQTYAERIKNLAKKNKKKKK